MKFSFKDLTTTLHDAVMEPEAKPAPESDVPVLGPSSTNILAGPEPTQNWNPPTPSYQPQNPLNQPYPATDKSGDVIYQLLVTKTNFDNTAVGKQVADHLIPLEGLPLTDAQKMQAVLKAGAKEGLTADKINTTYQDLLGTLPLESKKFNDSVINPANTALAKKKTSIAFLEADIQTLEATIAAKREQQSKLSGEIINDQAAIQEKQTTFAAAYNRRDSELKTAIQHTNDILKGIA